VSDVVKHFQNHPFSNHDVSDVVKHGQTHPLYNHNVSVVVTLGQTHPFSNHDVSAVVTHELYDVVQTVHVAVRDRTLYHIG
jgi:hypothetical protein